MRCDHVTLLRAGRAGQAGGGDVHRPRRTCCAQVQRKRSLGEGTDGEKALGRGHPGTLGQLTKCQGDGDTVSKGGAAR